MSKLNLKNWTHAEKIGAMTYQLYTIADCEVCGCDGKTADCATVQASRTRLVAAGVKVVAHGTHLDLGACDALGGIAVCCECYRTEEQVREEAQDEEPVDEVVDIHLDDCVDADEAIRPIDEQLAKPEVEKPLYTQQRVLAVFVNKLMRVGTLTHYGDDTYKVGGHDCILQNRKAHKTAKGALGIAKKRFGKLTLVEDTDEAEAAAVDAWKAEQVDIAKPEEAFKPLELESEKVTRANPAGLREDWLHEAVPYLRELILTRSSNGAAECDQDRPEPYLSVGWPKKSRGKAARIGECWSAQHESGRAHIFVSPELADAVRVLDVLVHELIHDTSGSTAGTRARSSGWLRMWAWRAR